MLATMGELDADTDRENSTDLSVVIETDIWVLDAEGFGIQCFFSWRDSFKETVSEQARC